MTRLQIVMASVVAAGLFGCTPPENGEPRVFRGQFPIKAVASTQMVGELVARVGGPWVKVDVLFGAGVDPHSYKPLPSDRKQLEQADIVFYNGLHLEGRMHELFDSLAQRKAVLAVGDQLPRNRWLMAERDTPDPHVWHDASLWKQGIAVVRDELIRYDTDPGHAAEYRANADLLVKEYDECHRRVTDRIATIPPGRRVMVTAHDAFHYFGRAYGITVKAVQGVSTESDVGTRDIVQLVDFLVANKIKAVFVESTVSDKNMQALLEGCRAKGHTLMLGGSLFSDALGGEGSAATYVGMMLHNAATIAEALR